jgi:hypothetical protein
MFDTIDWNEFWDELVTQSVKADEALSEAIYENTIGKLSARGVNAAERKRDRADERLDDRYVESTQHKLHAERLLASLQGRYTDLNFAAYTDPRAYPKYSWWRIVVCAKGGKAPSYEKLRKIQRAAKAILENIANKYPLEEEKYPPLPRTHGLRRSGCGVCMAACAIMGFAICWFFPVLAHVVAP